MRMKFYATLLALVLASNSLWAQSGHGIVWGATNPLTFRNAFYKLDILGADPTGVYAVQVPYEAVINGIIVGGAKGYKLARYRNPDMDKPEVVSLDLEDEGAERDFEFASKIGNDYVIFSSFQNRKLQKTFLFAQTVNTSTFALNKDLKKVAEIDFSQADKYKVHQFGYEWSPDKSKMLLHYKLNDKSGNVLLSGFNVLDSKLNLMWAGDDELALNPEEIFTFKQFQVDNKGNVYLLGTVFENRAELKDNNKLKSKGFLSGKKTFKREANYQHLLMKYTKGQPAAGYRINEKDGFVTDLQVTATASGDILLAGLYAQPNTATVVGACSFTIPNNGKAITTRNFHPFAADFMVRGTNDDEKKASQDDMDQNLYALENIQLHPDGSYTLIAEQYRVELVTARGANGTSSAGAEYHDENIILAHFSKSGKLLWNQRILKHQWTGPVSKIHASFKYHYYNGAWYFVYNNFSNANVKKAKAMLVKVNGADGKINKQEIFDANKEDVILVAETNQLLDKSTLLFYAQKKFNYQFLQVKL